MINFFVTTKYKYQTGYILLSILLKKILIKIISTYIYAQSFNTK